MPVQCLAHIGICVADLERSRRFYRDLLGFKEVSRLQVVDDPTATLLGLDDVDLHSVFLERDGARFELLYFAKPGCESGPVPRPMNRLGLTHLAIRVDDLEQLLGVLRREGITILDDTRIQNPEFQADVVYALDPDGLRLELIQSPGDPHAPIGEPIR